MTRYLILFLLWSSNILANPALVTAARSQIGETVMYDPAYKSLSFPMGDIDRSRGVCSDVV
ncbi:MAG: DUF1287 domain-containing protein, partial [Planktomarina sp.]